LSALLLFPAPRRAPAQPLHIAVASRQADIVQALLARGSDPSLTDGDGNNAAHIALAVEDLVILEVQLKRP
jgi:ankyrin repeat protein